MTRPAFGIHRIGLDAHPLRDLYHWLLVTSWPVFLGLVATAFLAGNALFALVYVLRPGCITGASTIGDTFFFSVHTMATIGYGTMSPATSFAQAVVVAEALCGLFFFAVITGLTFAKFSRPTARVLFSRVAVIGPRDGVPCLQFRMANERGNQIVEARLHVVLVRQEVTGEGEHIRRLIDLDLLRARSPMFALTWTGMHRIDAGSPLHGQTPESLAAREAQIIVSVTGLDDTLGQTVYARHIYAAADLRMNARFVDIIGRTPEGGRQIDYRRFHDTVSS